MAVAYNEHEQQHGDDGCEKHPPYSRSDHGRVDVVAGFSCNISQGDVARWGRSGRADTVEAALNNLFRWIHPLGLFSVFHFS